MPAPVYIDFVARGVPDIARAFRSVQDIATGAESGMTSSAVRGARSRVTVAEKEARDRIKAAKSIETADRKAAMGAAKERERLGRVAVSDAEKTARGIVSAEERAARMKVAAWIRADKTIAQAHAVGARARESAIKAESRAVARAEAEKNRESRRWVTRRENEQRTNRNHYADAISGGAARGVSNTMHQGFRAATAAAGVLTHLGGGFSTADAIGQQANLDRQSRLLSNSAYKPGEGVARVDPELIKNRAKAVSATVGIDSDELVEGARTYVQRSGGDMKGGMENMELFAKLSKATGAKYGDVTKAAGIIKSQNDEMTPQQQHDMLLHIVGQGRFGTVELDDLARGAGKITKTSSLYAGDQTTNQTKLLGLAQFANRTAGGSVSEAASEMSSFSSDAMKHHDKVNASLRGAGVIGGKESILNAHGELIAPEKLLSQVLQSTGGDMSKVQAQGFNMRSFKLFESLAPEFKREQQRLVSSGMSEKDASKGAGTFIEKKMNEMIAAPYSDKDLGEEFAVIMKGSAEQFEGAVRQLKVVVGEALLPPFIKLAAILVESIPTIKKWLDSMVSMVEWMADNPVKAGLVLLGANIAKEVMAQVAAAGIGAAMRGALGGGAGGSAPLGAGPFVGKGGALGALGAFSIIASTASIAIATGIITIDSLFNKEDKDREHGTKTAGDASSLAARIRNGTATPEERKKAEELQASMAGRQAAIKSEGETTYNPITGKFWKQELGRIASSPLVSAFSDDKMTPAQEHQAQLDQESKNIAASQKELTDAMKGGPIVAALDRNTAALGRSGGGGGGGGGTPPPPGTSPRVNTILDRNPFE